MICTILSWLSGWNIIRWLFKDEPITLRWSHSHPYVAAIQCPRPRCRGAMSWKTTVIGDGKSPLTWSVPMLLCRKCSGWVMLNKKDER